MSEDFIADIERASRQHGYDGRSQFIREAVREKLKSMGYDIPMERTLAPSRTRSQYPRKVDEAAMLNEKGASSSAPLTEKAAVKKAVEKAKHDGVVYGRSRKAGRSSGKTS